MTFWAVWTDPIGCVLVFNRPPQRKPNGRWKHEGMQHKWSRRDVEANGLTAALERDVPRQFQFVPDAVGRWTFTHQGDASKVLHFTTDGVWTEDFCLEEFPLVIRRPDLREGDAVSLVFQ